MSTIVNIEVQRDGQVVDQKSFNKEAIKIGGRATSDLHLDGEGVARIHAVIEVSGADVRLVDLGSKGGTALNGMAVSGNAALSDGDEVVIGGFSLKVALVDEATQAAHAQQAANAQQAAHAAAVAEAAKVARQAAISEAIAFDATEMEDNDSRPVAEVMSMLGSTVIDVSFVGHNSGARQKMVPALMGIGLVLVIGGMVIFGHEVSQDWEAWSTLAVDARKHDLPAPAAPGWGTGPLGIILMILGVVPLVIGAQRRAERVVRNFLIGEGHHATLHVPTAGLPDKVAFPLVRGGAAGDYSVTFAEGMTGSVTMGGATHSLKELVSQGRAMAQGGAYSFPLPADARCKVVYGDITFLINSVKSGKVLASRQEIDKLFLGYFGGVSLLTVLFAGLILTTAEGALGFDLDDGAGENRFVGFMNQPDEVKEEEPPPEEEEDSDEEAGGTGQRHKGAEGKMGKPSSKSKSGLYAMKGPKDAIPQMARNFDPEMAARQAGILGVMAQQSGHFLASPYGGAFAVGNDDSDVWGGLTGSEVGEAYGVGGLGLVGTGRGGGGTGEGTIGLGNTGLIGKGGGGGSGSGYGRGSGAGFGGKGKRVPRVRQAKAKVQGALDKDIIRRIVRSHINEVRGCYNQGLSRNPNLSGRVAVQFVIGTTGKVSNSVVASDTTKDKQVSRCIAKAVKRWKFPKPRGGGQVIVTYPFNLSPG